MTEIKIGSFTYTMFIYLQHNSNEYLKFIDRKGQQTVEYNVLLHSRIISGMIFSYVCG